MYDRQIPFDSLSEALLEKIGGKTRSHIMNYIYTNKKNTIASLFKIIVYFSNNNNLDAIKLLENAGKYLAEATCVSYEIKNFDKEILIGLKGGVFYNSSYVLSSYKNEINKKISNYSLIEKDISATKGVINIYKDGSLL